MFSVDTPRTPVAGIPAFEEPMRLVRGEHSLEGASVMIIEKLIMPFCAFCCFCEPVREEMREVSSHEQPAAWPGC